MKAALRFPGQISGTWAFEKARRVPELPKTRLAAARSAIESFAEAFELHCDVAPGGAVALPHNTDPEPSQRETP